MIESKMSRLGRARRAIIMESIIFKLELLIKLFRRVGQLKPREESSQTCRWGAPQVFVRVRRATKLSNSGG